jgi:predicted RNA methylase
MATKFITIDEPVKAVLWQGRWEGTLFFLPPGQLDRKLYEATDKVLRALGGKWDRGKRAHQFSAVAAAELVDALAEGQVVDQKKSLEQFFTPPEVAREVFARADLAPNQRVLEPSAGMGALLSEPVRLRCRITAYEIDDKLAVGLRGLIGHYDGCHVHSEDFLKSISVARTFDRVLMNPPFAGNADIAHVMRAMREVALGGRLVAVMSPHWTFAMDRASQDFREWQGIYGGEWTPLPEGSFAASGTNVSTGILVLNRGEL